MTNISARVESDTEHQLENQTINELTLRLSESTERARRDRKNIHQLQSLLVAATDQIRMLSSKLDVTSATQADRQKPDPRIQLPQAQGSEHSWMQSILEELAHTKSRLDKVSQKKSKLEIDLASRTRWARDMDRKADERTKWAQAADLEVLRLKEMLADHQRQYADLEAMKLKEMLAGHQRQSLFDDILGPGDRLEVFLKFSKFLWKLLWPIRFSFRITYRFFSRHLWNPLKWPAWIKRMSLIYKEHGFRGFLGVTARSTDSDIDSDPNKSNQSFKKEASKSRTKT